MQKKNNCKISALVITYNEERNIENCLKSIKWVDEIIIVDSYSNDRTVEIAEGYTKKIYLRRFDGDFSAQRNFALQHVNCEWVLVLDADEKLPNNAASIIEKLISTKIINGYWFPRRNYINEKIYLKHGYFYPDYQLRLFRNKENIKYSGIIHERLMIDSRRTKKIDDLEIYHNHSHTKYNSYLSFIRFFPFIKIEGENIALSHRPNIQLIIHGFADFMRHFYRSFFKKKGYKDGYIGLRAALLYGLYQGLTFLYAIVVRNKKSLWI